MDAPNPLAHGNRFQRRYYRWALPYYERFGRDDPLLRERVELADLYLYSRKGLGAWAGWWLTYAGAVAWLLDKGKGWGEALGVTAVVWLGLTCLLLGVWLKPKRANPWKVTPMFVGSAVLGVSAGWLQQHGLTGLQDWQTTLKPVLTTSVPLIIGAGLVVQFVARAGRVGREHQLARLQLVAERDAAALAAAEADLRLLQAQIHPHFIFNTLATLQHWVDRRDERAGPLLRELSGFLRSSTEMLGRASVPLADEAQAVRHYLAILSARLDGRVQGEVHIAPDLLAEPLPPGLLLTLVENAVEHGLEPKIGGGRLWVTGAREQGIGWWLRVEDDGLGLAEGAEDDVGLSNLRQRLRHHFGGRSQFWLHRRVQGGTRAEITITP
ncbi:histidine kinase [Roseateles sp.]|uniref:sensor histidine kinase n=1 Tax=Roseateles sp. TaxID=1971397 RepID=UPI0032665617